MNFSINEKLAEEIGGHIGDGSMNYYNNRGMYQLRGHIEDDKLHYLQRIKPLFEKIYGVKIKLREMRSTRVFGFQIWNDKIIAFKQQLGLPLGKKLELEIPKEFSNKKELLVACIRGIFDTDGGVYLEKKNNKLYPRVYISTISVKLAKQISEILNSLDLNATYYVSNHPNGNRLISYKVEVRGIKMLNKFFKIINPQNPKHQSKYASFLK
ncbi:MAG: LAGLIDADG family homing endonuclease [Nanoarchaeota archaeon]